MAASCQKPDNSTIPDVITLTVSEISENKIFCGGQVKSDGGKEVTERGVLIGRTDNPSADGNRIAMGSGLGLFQQWIENLNPGTDYYFCAYAVNEKGTAFGEVKAIQTKDIVTDVDGNIYTTVKIGDQTWMAENLKTIKYRNGDHIPNVTNQQEWIDFTSGAYCYYNNNLSNAFIYGNIYNWFALMDDRGLCPEGWNAPDIDDWMELIDFAGGLEFAAVSLKHKGLDFWEYPNLGANNTTGFTALPGGQLSSSDFHGINRFSTFWTSTEQQEGFMANYILMNSGMTRVFINMMFINYGHSVRCVKQKENKNNFNDEL